MKYKGFKIVAEYQGFSWHDPNADIPVSNLCKDEKECKEEINEHIELGNDSPYITVLTD
jgi:hypothetical protein